MESLNFVYRIPGFRGADRIYFVRRGLVTGWAAYPKGASARARVAEQVRGVFEKKCGTPAGLTPRQAAETLLVARWFRLKPKELKRTTPPTKWLAQAAA